MGTEQRGKVQGRRALWGRRAGRGGGGAPHCIVCVLCEHSSILTSLATGLAFSLTYLVNPFPSWCSRSNQGHSGWGNSHHGTQCEWWLVGSPCPGVADACQCASTGGDKFPWPGSLQVSFATTAPCRTGPSMCAPLCKAPRRVITPTGRALNPDAAEP